MAYFTISVVFFRFSFSRICCLCVPTVLTLTFSISVISLLVFPSVNSFSNSNSLVVIPTTTPNYRYKSFLFPFLFVRKYFHSYGYSKTFCLNKEKNNSIYLSVIWNCNWYKFCIITFFIFFQIVNNTCESSSQKHLTPLLTISIAPTSCW